MKYYSASEGTTSRNCSLGCEVDPCKLLTASLFCVRAIGIGGVPELIQTV